MFNVVSFCLICPLSAWYGFEFKQVAQLATDGIETLAAAYVESVPTGQMISPGRTHMSREPRHAVMPPRGRQCSDLSFSKPYCLCGYFKDLRCGSV